MGVIPTLALAACATSEPAGPALGFFDGVQIDRLDEELINVRARIGGVGNDADAIRYAECAAARYTLVKSNRFARHVRTTVEETETGLQADAVFLISAELPSGSRTLDAEVIMADCEQSGIPTV